jgi:hypothetical protein
MTYTNIPPISYIFVGITTAVLSYVTWAEMQENSENIEEPPSQVEQNVIGGKKRHSKTKRKRTKKNKKKTKHAKLNRK